MTKTIIYIRHGPDKKSNYKNDEKLTSEGKELARTLSKDLIEKYGLPDVIYYSPFYRTRQTRKEMIKVIENYLRENDLDHKIKLKIDVRLGRFFSKKERKRPDIHRSTFEKGAIVNEHFSEFQERVEEQLEHVLNHKKYEKIWNITHTLVLLHVARVKSLEHNEHVEYLDTLVIEE